MKSKKLLLVVAAGGAAAVAAAGALAGNGHSSAVTTVKAISKPPTVVVNRYVQDGLRWDKDVYKVQSGGTIHVVNNAADEGPHTFTIVAKKDLPKTAKASQLQDLRDARRGPRRGPEQRRAAEVPRSSRTASGRTTPPNVDKPGDSGVTGEGKKGESIDLQGHRQEGHEAVLHVPHPSVDAGEGHRRLRPRVKADVSRGPWRSAGALALSAAAPAASATRARLLGRGRADVLEHRAQRPRRDHGHAGRPAPTRSSRRSSTAATRANWSKPMPNAPTLERRRAARSRAR